LLVLRLDDTPSRSRAKSLRPYILVHTFCQALLRA
jgi:hypothetical protein